ncbi:MAG: glycosyltransferase family 1 protein [Proteobacteria bacterium]|nr:glycosyltransferase family 1 protein [Pseudomonadota bacterium]
MKIAIATYGTEGDTRPLAALGRALLDAGHQVRFLADAATLDSATTLGIATAPLAGDIKTALQPEKETRPAEILRTLTEMTNTHAESWLREVVAAGTGCDAIIVSALAAFVGLAAAEFLGIPAIGAGSIPITPTTAFASPFLPPTWVPRWLNEASHRFINNAVWRLLRKQTNAARERVCSLPPQRGVPTDHPMLWGVSPSLLPRPDDYPSTAIICGQWTAPTRHWQPPPELTEFLNAGEPPLYVGFGSMAGLLSPAALSELIAGIGGRRALFYAGWSTIRTGQLPSNFLLIRDTPHDWLLPRTSAIIHHGGAGTSHSAARAGVPCVVVPFAGDQPFWANRLHQLGVAPRPISARSLRRSTLAEALELMEQPPVRARAAALGAQMRCEDGLGTAVLAIETLVRNGNRVPARST